MFFISVALVGIFFFGSALSSGSGYYFFFFWMYGELVNFFWKLVYSHQNNSFLLSGFIGQFVFIIDQFFNQSVRSLRSRLVCYAFSQIVQSVSLNRFFNQINSVISWSVFFLFFLKAVCYLVGQLVIHLARLQLIVWSLYFYRQCVRSSGQFVIKLSTILRHLHRYPTRKHSKMLNTQILNRFLNKMSSCHSQ